MLDRLRYCTDPAKTLSSDDRIRPSGEAEA
jgi:hypothetical protein